MDKKECKKHVFIKDWTNHYYKLLKVVFPDYSKKEIKNFLYDIAAENVQNPEVKLDNNYIHEFIRLNLLDIPDWIEKTKPIVAGHGVFFRNQHQVINPPAQLLSNSMAKRKAYKDKMKSCEEGTYGYDMYDRFQGAEKVIANSFYGAQGATSSDYYNLYTATSVTSTAQSLTSTAKATFEAFVSGTIGFFDLDDCLIYVRTIIDEKYKIDEEFLPIVFPEMVFNRLKNMFHEWKESYLEPLQEFIYSLSRRNLKRIYYKNNLHEFFDIPEMNRRLTDVFMKVEDFKNPNKIPQEIQGDIDELWKYCEQFVFTNQFFFGRIKRLKAFKRRAVVTIDTDSTMINLFPWIKYCRRTVIKNDEILSSREVTANNFIAINTMCAILTKVITASLNEYTKTSNIPFEIRPNINMKNEFCFLRMVLTEKKKRYASAIKLREGNEFKVPKIDVKGADFMKSSAREETKEYFTNLLRDEILLVDEISFSRVLRKVADFEGIIMDSLKNGERHFLIPKNVKEPEAYKNPYGQQGFRAVLLWNAVYPDNPIQLPEKIDMVKMSLTTDDELEKLKAKYPDIYKAIYNAVLLHPNQKYAEKKAGVIAIPSFIDKIPDWILEFTDYDTIVSDNVSKFNSFIDSIGGSRIKGSNNAEHFSNIIKI